MKKGNRFILLFTLFWSGIVLLFDGMMARNFYRQWRSESFVPAEGRVLSSDILRDTSGENTTYRARVRYEYFLGEKRYESEVVRFGEMGDSAGRLARETVQANPAGTRRTIYFNPARPAEAVLDRGVSSQQMFMAVFLTPFNAAMVFLVGLAWHSHRPTPPAGGAVIKPVGRELQVNFKRFTRFAIGVGVLGGVGFVGSFILAFGWKMSPPLGASLGVLAVAAGLSVLAVVWKGRRSPDLIIDPEQGSVSLRQGRVKSLGTWREWRRAGKPRAVIPFSAIRSVAVQERISKSSDGESRTYVPVLGATSTPGNEIDYDLGTWLIAEHAEAFAAWLRETLGLTAGVEGRK